MQTISAQLDTECNLAPWSMDICRFGSIFITIYSLNKNEDLVQFKFAYNATELPCFDNMRIEKKWFR